MNEGNNGVNQERLIPRNQVVAMTKLGIFNHVSAKKDKVYPACSMLTEMDFYAFSAYNIFLPDFIRQFKDAAPHLRALGPLWNYLDAVWGGITGVFQLLDKYSHRKTTTQIKGITNLAVSVQAIVLTALNFSLYGGPAFAAGSGMMFVHSLDETIRYIRHIKDPQYWYDDTTAELTMLDNQITDLLGDEWDFEDEPENAILGEPVDELTKKMRTYEYILQKFNNNEKDATLVWLRELAKKGKALIEQLQAYKAYNNGRLQPGLPLEILQKCEENLAKALIDNVAFALAFAGMIVLCIGDAKQTAVGFIVTASTLFILKHARVIDKGATECAKQMTANKMMVEAIQEEDDIVVVHEGVKIQHDSFMSP